MKAVAMLVEGLFERGAGISDDLANLALSVAGLPEDPQKSWLKRIFTRSDTAELMGLLAIPDDDDDDDEPPRHIGPSMKRFKYRVDGVDARYGYVNEYIEAPSQYEASQIIRARYPGCRYTVERL